MITTDVLTSASHLTTSPITKQRSFVSTPPNPIDHYPITSSASVINSLQRDKITADITTKVLLQSGRTNQFIRLDSTPKPPNTHQENTHEESPFKTLIQDVLPPHHLSTQQQTQIKKEFSQLEKKFSQDMKVLLHEVAQEDSQDHTISYNDINSLVCIALYEATLALNQSMQALGQSAVDFAKALEEKFNEHINKMKEYRDAHGKYTTVSWFHGIMHNIISTVVAACNILGGIALFTVTAGAAAVQAFALIAAGSSQIICNVASWILNEIDMDPNKRSKIQLGLTLTAATINTACALVCPVSKGLSALAGKLGVVTAQRALQTVYAPANLNHTTNIISHITTGVTTLESMSSGGISIVKHGVGSHLTVTELAAKMAFASREFYKDIQVYSNEALSKAIRTLNSHMNLFIDCVKQNTQSTSLIARNTAAA